MPKYDHILNVAHRGGPIDRPENTFAAFDHAPSSGLRIDVAPSTPRDLPALTSPGASIW